MEVETQAPVSEQAGFVLSEQDQSVIVGFVKKTWEDGEKERSPYKKAWEKHEEAYSCKYEPKQDKRLKWRTRSYFPWVFDACRSAHAYIYSSTLPKDDDLFYLEARTKEDQETLNDLSEFERYHFEKALFSQKYDNALENLFRKGHLIMKTYWRNESWIEYPISKQIQAKPEEKSQQGLAFSVVCPDDYVFYPIGVDKRERTEIERVERYIEDIIATAENGSAPYMNIDKLKEKQGKRNKDEEGKPVCVKEAWIHRIVVNGRVFRNYIATVVDNEILIRFQPNRYPAGCSPYTFFALEPDGPNNWGYPLCEKVLSLLYAANDELRLTMDNLKLQSNQMYKYWDDGVFDPYSFISRPGLLVEMHRDSVISGNIQPLQSDLSKYQVLQGHIEFLKNEFLEVTIPQIIKGQIEDGTKTATEANYIHQSSGSKLAVIADRLNKGPLRDVVKMGYMLLTTMMQTNPTVINEFLQVVTPTQVDPATNTPMPLDNQTILTKVANLPVSELDVKVVGYDNFVRRQAEASNLEGFITNYAQTPGAKYLKWYELGMDGGRLLGLDMSRIMVDEEERKKIDEQEAEDNAKQAESQQALAMANLDLQKDLVEVEKLKIISNKEIAIEKETTQRQKYLLDLEVEEAKLELSQAEIEAKFKVKLPESIGEELDEYTGEMESNGREAKETTGES